MITSCCIVGDIVHIIMITSSSSSSTSSSCSSSSSSSSSSSIMSILTVLLLGCADQQKVPKVPTGPDLAQPGPWYFFWGCDIRVMSSTYNKHLMRYGTSSGDRTS